MTSAPRPGLGRAAEPSAAMRALLEGVIDYAGLFPPAGLAMPETVANFAAYQGRSDSWALGRLVVPAARLAEFEAALAGLSDAARLGTRWPLTVLAGPDWSGDLATIREFNQRHIHGGPQVLSLEGKTGSVEQVNGFVRAAAGEFEVYCEPPLGASLDRLTEAVRDAGARAKVRAGGVTAAEFPSPDAVLGLVLSCARTRLPFKATAGLHHLVRGPAPLTYAPGSDRATMYGYLNLLLAAAVIWAGRPEAEARRLLTAMGREGLDLQDEGAIHWDGLSVSVREIQAAREEFVLAIGSCSFTEPLGEAFA